MDKNVSWVNQKKIENTIKSLENNNMKGYFAKDQNELIEIINSLTETDSLGKAF